MSDETWPTKEELIDLQQIVAFAKFSMGMYRPTSGARGHRVRDSIEYWEKEITRRLVEAAKDDVMEGK